MALRNSALVSEVHNRINRYGFGQFVGHSTRMHFAFNKGFFGESFTPSTLRERLTYQDGLIQAQIDEGYIFDLDNRKRAA